MLLGLYLARHGAIRDGEVCNSIARKALPWLLGVGLIGALIFVLMQRQVWQRWLAPFAAVGRFALTNYLITCFVYAVVFLPWGFGLYNILMPFEGLVMVLLVFPLQMMASRWWISRFRFGPCEWMWRSMTYGRLPAVRLHRISK